MCARRPLVDGECRYNLRRVSFVNQFVIRDDRSVSGLRSSAKVYRMKNAGGRLRGATLLFPVLLCLTGAANAESPALHPLQIHMQQWLQGSGQWRSPNPNYDAGRSGGFKEYGINWTWHPARKYMAGEITGVTPDGAQTRFWSMYAFYNPVTQRVSFQQIGRDGTLVTADDAVRAEPLEYGETERLETTEYSATGETKLTRHDNVFREDGTHTSSVYERDESGVWALTAQWKWTLVETDDGEVLEPGS